MSYVASSGDWDRPITRLARLRLSSIGWPVLPLTVSTSSPGDMTGLPSTASIVSPPRSPACSAGEPGATEVMTTDPPTSASCGSMSRTVKITTGRTKFMIDPAERTMSRFNTEWRAKLSGSVGSSSPTIFTNPPRGITFSE